MIEYTFDQQGGNTDAIPIIVVACWLLLHRYSHFKEDIAASFRISADMDARNAKAWNGIPSAHLFAYSCGTNVGMYMGSKYPEKVRSLIAVGAGTAPNPEGSEDFLPEILRWQTAGTALILLWNMQKK